MSLDVDRLSSDVERILLDLPRAKRRADEIYFSCFRADRHRNGDATASASYSVARGAWRCKGCGASGGLVKGDHPIARLLGLDLDTYGDTLNGTDQQPQRADRTWEIRDTEGNVVALHHRRDLGGGRKKVWWERDGQHTLGGFPVSSMPLYGVDRLGEREPGDDAPVIVCEGEPATDALLELGLRAVGTVTGAGSAPSIESLEPLRGANVALWPDADDAGREHAERIAWDLQGIAASVRVFTPDLCEKEDAADWVRAHAGRPNLATELLAEIEEHARPALPQRPESEAPAFESLADDVGYRLRLPALAASLEVSHMRRERHQLKAELLARCSLPGASTFDGVLTVTDLNMSSARSRKELAGHLAERSSTETGDWQAAVEELSQRVLAAEREGEPDVALPDVEVVETRVLDVDGLRLPQNHPAIVFGDGDSAKSYTGLYVLGCLARRGLRVGLADWELGDEDHRERLGRLFPDSLPGVRYLRCSRPIVQEADRLRRWVRERRLDFVMFDSVAYACAGAPESAEVAMAYFQVVRQLGKVGSLHIAHITKAAEGADRRPFGSAFWHNSPRATWFAKLAERDPGGTTSRLGLYPRKWNIGPMPPAVGLELCFQGDLTTVRKVNVTDNAELAATLPVKQRMLAALQAGPLTAKELAEEIDSSDNTVRVTANRNRGQFRFANGVVYLAENQHG